MRSVSLVFGIWLIALLPAVGQQVGRQFQQLTTSNGLSQNAITDIFQDSHGFMWFSTRDGLNRYDGYNFKVYRYDPANPNSLSGNYINSITEDHDGNLWIANLTNQGLNRYNRRTDTFTRFRHNPEDPPSLADETLHDAITDREGFVWLATRTKGVEKLNPKTGKFTHFRHDAENPNSLSTDRTASLMQSRSGHIWVGLIMEGVNRLDPKTGQVKQFLIDPSRKNVAANVVYSLTEDSQGVVWLATAAGVYTLNQATGAISQPEILKHITVDIPTIQESPTGEIWIGGKIWISGQSALWVLNKTRDKLDTYTHDPKNPAGISDRMIAKIYHDRSGITWIGTLSNGLNIYDPKRERFPLYRFGPVQQENLGANSVTAIHEDADGDLWVGLRTEGIRQYNRKTGQVNTFKHNPANANSPAVNNITCFFSDGQGTLWFGTEHGGLGSYNKTSGKFSRFEPDKNNPNAISHNWVLSVAPAGPDALWVGTNGGGLELLNTRTGTFSHFPLAPLASGNPGEGEFIISIQPEKDGTLWLGTVLNGICHFNPKTGKLTRYLHDSAKTGTLSYNNTASLLLDKQGTLWVGTWGGGLNRFDKKTGTFTAFTLQNGLPSNSVFSIQEDKKGQLWMSTSHGISCFNPKTQTFRNYDVQDGLQDNEFNPFGANYQSASGELFFGGAKGLTAFFPDKIRDNSFLPPVQLVNFTFLNRPEIANAPASAGKEANQVRNISELDSLTLHYTDNNFSIGFAALGFTDAAGNRYAYKMEGFDEHWINARDRRQATYTNLDPGTYTFRVKASNNDGLWNPTEKTLHLTILPPPWRTWWAYALYTLAGMGILLSLRRYWKRQERLEHDLKLQQLESEKLHELDQLKTRFFTSISHEFRTPLTLILSPLEQLLLNGGITENLRSQYLLMHRNAQRLLQLINQLLDISKLEAGSMKLKAAPHNLVQFLRPLVYSFSSLAETRHIQLQLNTATEEAKVWFDADLMEKIMTNLLSNAIKFTPENGRVTVAVNTEGIAGSTDKGFAVISISDSGIGIPEDRLGKVFNRFYQIESQHPREHEGTGIGLALVHELVQLHGGQITVESKLHHGSTFTIKLPLGHAHLNPEQIATAPISVAEGASPETTEGALPISDEFTEVNRQTGPLLNTDLPLLLVVEDNPDVRRFVCSQFAGNYKVLEASNGRSGLQLATEELPDLIISDLMMPEMDGLELCRLLKTDERTSHVPVILLTAKAAVESKLEGLETGADDYLVKPFQPQELQLRVRNLIAQRQRLRERYAGKIIKLEPTEVTINSRDEAFMTKAMAVVEENLGNAAFDVETFCREIGMSRMQLHRKLKALTDQSTTEFIRSMRLKRAAQLLRHDAGNVAEVAYQVGFQSLSYFSKSFKEFHGCSPSEFQARTTPEPLES